MFLIPPHPLTNFEIQKCYKYESRCNGYYSRHKLPNKEKDGTHVINLDEYSDIGLLCMNEVIMLLVLIVIV